MARCYGLSGAPCPGMLVEARRFGTCGAVRRAVPLLGGGVERVPRQGGLLSCVGGTRGVSRNPPKAHGMVLGHKLEVIYGQHTYRKHNPPKIPIHPLQDVAQNMNEVITYNDLKIRWQWTTTFKNRHMNIARVWKPRTNMFPLPEPTCAFIWHRQMPHRERMPEMPPPRDFKELKTDNAFAIFQTSPIHQHKVTVGDLVQCEKLHRREAGEKVVFGTVLLVGTRTFTIIGKPTVPYAKVKATIEQQTLTRELLHFKYKSRRKQSKFLRKRQYVTMLRIDEIVVDPEGDQEDLPTPKPVRLLDLWANRWLDPAEKEGIEMVETPEGQRPKAAEFYDGSEHQPGTYHRRGLTECYRFWPDPRHGEWRN